MRPVRRAIHTLTTLGTQPLFYLLLVLIGPLMLALHWTAIRFPILYPDYTQASLFEVEPDRLAVIFEPCGEQTRWEVWVLSAREFGYWTSRLKL